MHRAGEETYRVDRGAVLAVHDELDRGGGYRVLAVEAELERELLALRMRGVRDTCSIWSGAEGEAVGGGAPRRPCPRALRR